jgi:signal peptide peptidase SppA
MITDLHNPKCFNNHMGVWAMEPLRARAMLDAIQSGLLSADESNLETPLATQTISGIRLIPVSGMMQKGRSKFSGTSTIDVRKEIAAANRDESINGIMLVIDSGGGHSSGTQALADAISGSTKPVRAHVDDFMASAALWIASVTERISADKTSQVGSIGTFTVLQDVTGALEAEGVTLHLVSTGPLKGAGADGEVTPDLLAEVQKIVDDVNSFFLESVMSGRGMSAEQLAPLATGAMFNAQEALSNGLIDSISDIDAALADFIDSTGKSRSNSAKAKISIAKRR